jgi:hypothetical protein
MTPRQGAAFSNLPSIPADRPAAHRQEPPTFSTMPLLPERASSPEQLEEGETVVSGRPVNSESRLPLEDRAPPMGGCAFSNGAVRSSSDVVPSTEKSYDDDDDDDDMIEPLFNDEKNAKMDKGTCNCKVKQFIMMNEGFSLGMLKQLLDILVFHALVLSNNKSTIDATSVWQVMISATVWSVTSTLVWYGALWLARIRLSKSAPNHEVLRASLLTVSVAWIASEVAVTSLQGNAFFPALILFATWAPWKILCWAFGGRSCQKPELEIEEGGSALA